MKNKLFMMMCCLLMIISAGCGNDDDNSSLYNTWILASYGNESNEVLKEAKGYFLPCIDLLTIGEQRSPTN